MQNQYETFMTLAYLILTLGVITAEHFTFGRWWKHNEMARRTMGIITVLGLLAPFVFFFDVLDVKTFTIVCLGFLVAGGTKLFFVQVEKENQRQKRIDLERMVDSDEVGI